MILKGGKAVNWEAIAEQLQTRNIISHLTGLDPLSVATNPYIMVIVVAAVGVLSALRMMRTLGTIVAAVILWCGVFYAFPHHGQEIELHNLGVFAGIALAAIALLIYVYFIRGD
jgi:hypothetical protein